MGPPTFADAVNLEPAYRILSAVDFAYWQLSHSIKPEIRLDISKALDDCYFWAGRLKEAQLRWKVPEHLKNRLNVTIDNTEKKFAKLEKHLKLYVNATSIDFCKVLDLLGPLGSQLEAFQDIVQEIEDARYGVHPPAPKERAGSTQPGVLAQLGVRGRLTKICPQRWLKTTPREDAGPFLSDDEERPLLSEGEELC